MESEKPCAFCLQEMAQTKLRLVHDEEVTMTRNIKKETGKWLKYVNYHDEVPARMLHVLIRHVAFLNIRFNNTEWETVTANNHSIVPNFT